MYPASQQQRSCSSLSPKLSPPQYYPNNPTFLPVSIASSKNIPQRILSSMNKDLANTLQEKLVTMNSPTVLHTHYGQHMMLSAKQRDDYQKFHSQGQTSPFSYQDYYYNVGGKIQQEDGKISISKKLVEIQAKKLGQKKLKVLNIKYWERGKNQMMAVQTNQSLIRIYSKKEPSKTKESLSFSKDKDYLCQSQIYIPEQQVNSPPRGSLKSLQQLNQQANQGQNRVWCQHSNIQIQAPNFVISIQWLQQDILMYLLSDGSLHIVEYSQIQQMNPSKYRYKRVFRNNNNVKMTPDNENTSQQAADNNNNNNNDDENDYYPDSHQDEQESIISMKWIQKYLENDKIIMAFCVPKLPSVGVHRMLYLFATVDGYIVLKQLKTQKYPSKTADPRVCYDQLLTVCLIEPFRANYWGKKQVNEKEMDMVINCMAVNHQYSLSQGQHRILAIGCKQPEESERCLKKIIKQMQDYKSQNKQKQIHPKFLSPNLIKSYLDKTSYKDTKRKPLKFLIIQPCKKSSDDIYIDIKIEKQQSYDGVRNRANTNVSLKESINSSQSHEDISSMISDNNYTTQLRIYECPIQIPGNEMVTVNSIEWGNTIGRSYQLLGLSTSNGLRILEIKQQKSVQNQLLNIKLSILRQIIVMSDYECLKVSWSYNSHFISVSYKEKQQQRQQRQRETNRGSKQRLKELVRTKIFFSPKRGSWLHYKTIPE